MVSRNKRVGYGLLSVTTLLLVSMVLTGGIYFVAATVASKAPDQLVLSAHNFAPQGVNINRPESVNQETVAPSSVPVSLVPSSPYPIHPLP